jgi:hypothetical protein
MLPVAIAWLLVLGIRYPLSQAKIGNKRRTSFSVLS